MEAGSPRNFLVSRLAERYRVILLGGMAVIAHGRSRHTKDIDIWLEPFGTPEEWTAKLNETVQEFPEAYLWSLAQRRRLEAEEATGEIEQFSVLRIGGLHQPIDVFREPNEFSAGDFPTVWESSAVIEGNVALPDEIDLLVTKINTGREHDLDDIAFLESKIKARFRERLPVCDPAEAVSLLDRFLDPEVLQHARGNPHPEVRAMALKYLREFAAEGDPYSRDILDAGWEE